MTSLTALAHAGPGHTWQAMVVVAAVVLAAALLAAGIGLIRVERPDDLVLPLAVAAVISTAAPLGSEWISDAIGWGLPLGAVSLVALLLGALTRLDLRLPAPLPMGAITLAAIAGVALYPTLTRELHPPAEVLPLSDDGQVTIEAPADGDRLEAGTLEVTVRVDGGSLGPGDVPLEQLPDDPEEAGALVVALATVAADGTTSPLERLDVEPRETCTVTDPCTTVTFPLELEPGTHRLTVELTRGDGTPLAPPVRDSVELTAQG